MDSSVTTGTIRQGTRRPMCKPAQLPDRCVIGSWRENQIVKLKRRSDPSTGLGADNRMYYEPSAQRRIQFYWTRNWREISVCSGSTIILPESTELQTGIMFGGCGKRGDPSCRGGGADARSLFGARDSKEISLLCLPSRCHHIVAYGECPGTGDNGNGRMLAVTWPAD